MVEAEWLLVADRVGLLIAEKDICCSEEGPEIESPVDLVQEPWLAVELRKLAS